MRPSLYSETLADDIVNRLSVGETLVAICSGDGMPAPRTVRDWCKSHPEFGERYDAAMADGCHALIDQTLTIADNVREDPQSRKVRIWARHELAARKRPDLFGSKVKLEHTGAGGGPVKHELTMDPAEAYKRLIDGN